MYLIPDVIIYTSLLVTTLVVYTTTTLSDPTDSLYYIDKEAGFKIEEIDPEAAENK